MIKLTGKLSESTKGLMIGNGVLGALIFGDKNLTVSLDRIDLWDKRDPDEYKDPRFDYAHFVDYINNDYKEAFRLFDGCYNHPYPTKLNACLLSTNIPVSDRDTSSIDCRRGVVNYNALGNSLTGYVDANKDVIVLRFSKPCGILFSMAPYLTRPLNERGLGYEEASLLKDGDYTAVIQNTVNGESFHVLSLKVNNAYYITVNQGSDIEKSKELLSDYVENEEAYFAGHQKAYRSYFAKSEITTPDRAVNDEFDLGRYYFFANSRKKYPVSLHGVWTSNNGDLPPWKADLHNDINLEMSYEHYLKLGNLKEGRVLLDYLVSHKPVFEHNAVEFMHSKGMYIPGVMSQEGLPLGGWPQYAMNPCCQIWLIKAFDEYYRYTEDKKYLKETVFPFFREVEECVFSVLHLNEEGHYELGFHSSPEYYENDRKSVFARQTNFELTMLRYLYEKLCEYSNILGTDGKHYKDVLNHLADYYRNENGELTVSPDQEYDMSHRHFSHMLMYKNMKMSDPFENEKEISLDIARLNRFGTDSWVGFSFVENAGLYAYVRNGEEAYRNLKIFTDAFIHRNGFHMNNDYKNLGYSKMDCYVFTLEANFGFLTSLGDMMLQNYGKKIAVFPAIPESFRNDGVSFKKLRLHGNHTCDAEYKNNKLSFSIRMHKKDTVYLYNNFSNDPVIYVDGEKRQCFAKIGEFIEISASREIRYRQ